VIFDLDGTLLDSRPGIVAGLRRTLAHLGHQLPADAPLDWAIGPPLAEVWTRLLAPFADPRVGEAVTCYRTWYREVGLFDAVPYPGIIDLLDRLADGGKILVVGTAKRTEFARPMLAHFDLAKRFRGIYGSEPGGRFDVKADLFRHILEAEGLDPAATVVVGDRAHDVTGAGIVGLRVVSVTWGYGSREELLTAGARVLCDTPSGLAELL
jgi:phosphoglycolate phosphatase